MLTMSLVVGVFEDVAKGTSSPGVGSASITSCVATVLVDGGEPFQGFGGRGSVHGPGWRIHEPELRIQQARIVDPSSRIMDLSTGISSVSWKEMKLRLAKEVTCVRMGRVCSGSCLRYRNCVEVTCVEVYQHKILMAHLCEPASRPGNHRSPARTAAHKGKPTSSSSGRSSIFAIHTRWTANEATSTAVAVEDRVVESLPPFSQIPSVVPDQQGGDHPRLLSVGLPVTPGRLSNASTVELRQRRRGRQVRQVRGEPFAD